MKRSPLHDPKSFINDVLIGEIGNISKTNAYLSFALIAIAIEFLGKCEDESINNWDEDKGARKTFNLAISKLLPRYKKYNLYKSLRCGLAHFLAPQTGLNLGEKKKGDPHLTFLSDGSLCLTIEELYLDFQDACEKVIEKIDKKIYKNDKMYRSFLESKIDI